MLHQISIADWSDCFGITSRHVRRLMHDGVLPRHHGTITEDEAKAVVKAFLDYKAIDPANEALLEQRTRLLKIRADRAALELERERKSLIRSREAMLVWGAILEYVKRDAKTLPKKWAPALHCKEMPQIKQALEDFVFATLTKWSNPDLKEVARTASGMEASKRTSKRKQRFKKGPR